MYTRNVAEVPCAGDEVSGHALSPLNPFLRSRVGAPLTTTLPTVNTNMLAIWVYY
ncbi:uncharacterized protein MYCFIDRAFT_177085 [Pseudocercospora fijiensis CIRAD86]|uniref:Uncharacterized protein n=1 Tax=Pseudocercospora fijiensis (strain CIRAD86) TaxID=383855 RepID=M3ASH7_PSEFD|nr:uncharacterized protein MYCFIDRAFT_177085 [Pseudocercospora fijiensis CIRAD86]EME80108.1 hypothetical protein MYCFIDRAFT_177085 [Pseudocercospora fijiensis CIRAD86]